MKTIYAVLVVIMQIGNPFTLEHKREVPVTFVTQIQPFQNYTQAHTYFHYQENNVGQINTETREIVISVSLDSIIE